MQTALSKAGAQPQAVEDVSKGLRAITTKFDVAILDGATKSLTLNWAVGELKKRNPAVKLFTLGGTARADAIPLPADSSADAIARLLCGSPPERADVKETSARVDYEPLYLMQATRKGTPVWVIGTEVEELYERFEGLVVSLTSVPRSDTLPTMLEFGRDDAGAWAAFQPLPAGCSLADLNRVLRNEKARLSLDAVVYVAQRCCEGLALLHGAGVRHGMVRPQSLWLPDGGAPLLRFGALGELMEGDRLLSKRSTFGSAKRHDDLSPEQFLRHQRGDWRTDLYQLGHLLFEALSDRSPFLQRPHDRPLTAPRTHAPEIPRELSEVVVAMLAQEPGDRPTLDQVQVVLSSVAGDVDDALEDLADTRARLRTLLSM